MKTFKILMAGLGAASLAVASSASAAPVRASADTAEESNAMGGNWVAIIGVLLVVALAAIAAFGDDDESPVSP